MKEVRHGGEYSVNRGNNFGSGRVSMTVNEIPRRRAAWPWIVSITIIVIVLVVAGFMVAIESAADTAWSRFLQDHRGRLGSFRNGPPERPTLSGAADNANAWDAYLPALSALKALTDEERAAVSEALTSTAPPETREKGTAILRKVEPHLDALRAAARSARARYDLDLSKGWRTELPHLAQTILAARLLTLSAQGRHGAGDVDGAIVDLETALQLSLDSMDVEALICGLAGMASINISLDAAREILTGTKLTAASLERLEHVLRTVDLRVASVTRLLEYERLFLGQTFVLFVEKGEDPGVGNLRWTSWRHGFSLRLMTAESMAHYDRYVEAMREAESLDWTRASARIDAAVKELEEANNPLTTLTIPGTAGVARGLRECRARLRVLIAAAILRRGDPPRAEWPIDPFALKPIERADKGAQWSVWSTWHDGVAAGVGSWHPGPTEDLGFDVPK